MYLGIIKSVQTIKEKRFRIQQQLPTFKDFYEKATVKINRKKKIVLSCKHKLTYKDKKPKQKRQIYIIHANSDMRTYNPARPLSRQQLDMILRLNLTETLLAEVA